MASNSRSAIAYRIVVSIEWQSGNGTRRYSDQAFAIPFAGNPPIGVDGRLVSTSSLTLAVDKVSDSATVTLDNTGFGGTETVENNWNDTHPPEGTAAEIAYAFEGDDWADRVILIYGKVAEVSAMTDREVSLIIHGIDATLPQQINVEISSTNFPDAPRASLGQMQPFVFGSPKRMEGIPVTTIARTQTTGPVLAADTTIAVGDVTQLSAPGTVLIELEQVSYTGITGQTLTGCTRGANSTHAIDHGSGMPVVTVGQLDILIAGHDITAIDHVWGVSGTRIALLDPSTYTTSLSQPAEVHFANGWPTIPVPAGGLATVEVQMDAVTSNNTTPNAASRSTTATSRVQRILAVQHTTSRSTASASTTPRRGH